MLSVTSSSLTTQVTSKSHGADKADHAYYETLDVKGLLTSDIRKQWISTTIVIPKAFRKAFSLLKVRC